MRALRRDGRCEVDPRMTCAWIDAIAGTQPMRAGSSAIHMVQVPADRRLAGRSAWLAAARAHAGAPS